MQHMTTHPSGPEFVDTPLRGVASAPLSLRGIRFDNGEGGAAPAGGGDGGAAAAAGAAGAAGAGAAGAAPADAAAAGAAAAGADAGAAGAAAGAAGAAGAGTGEGIDFDALDPKTQGYIRGLRNENQTTRQKAEAEATTRQQQEQERLDAVLIALGVKKADEPNDPAKLQSQIAEAQNTAEATRRENAVLRYAPAEVDTDALLDSASFNQKLAGVNPGDKAAVQAAIAEFLTNQGTRFNRTVIGGSSGTSGSGAGGDRTTPTTPGTLQDAILQAQRATR